MTTYAQKRRHERVAVDLTVYWGLTPACVRQGRVNSLSAGGCLLETGEDVPVGEEVYIRLRWAGTLAGEVRYRVDDSGLGVAFKGVEPPAAEVIGSMVGAHSARRGPSTQGQRGGRCR